MSPEAMRPGRSMRPITACGQRLVEVLLDAGLPPKLVALVQGKGAKVGQAITASRGVDALTFTGSYGVGKQIAASLSTDTRVQLEMGGKNATVVLGDASLDKACAVIERGAHDMLQSLMSLMPGEFVPGHLFGMGLMVFVAALLQGIGGLGFAMISAPLAVLFFPEMAPGPLLVLGAGLALLGLLRDFDAVDWPSVTTLMVGRAGGTLLAGATLAALPTNAFSIVFALLILIGVGLSFAGRKVEASHPNMVLAGVASGLMGTITSSGAPPFAIVMRYVPPRQMRATVSCVFFAGAILSLLMLAYVDRFTLPQLWLGILLFPLMLGGFFVSNRLNRYFSPHGVRVMLLTMSGLGALGILARTLVQ